LITDILGHAIATGNWGRRLVGVSQLLERTNYLSTISHLRRIQSTLSRSQANFEARDLHPTQWGRIDPSESPEGSNCGLVKNMTLLTQVSVTADVEEIRKTLESLGVLPADQADENVKISWAEVYVSGIFLGYHNEGRSLAKELIRLRRRGRLSSQVNIGVYTHDYGGVQNTEVVLNADPGRSRRPLIVVEEGVPRLRMEHVHKLKAGELTVDDLVDIGVVEYLDAEEEEMSLIAPDLKSISAETTHLEVSPLAIFGAVTSVIPFAEHNQSPRNTYEGAMAKQALGYPTAALPFNFSTTSHYLIYPQTPLVTTDTSEVVGLEKNPIGQNFIVAILSDPYDMEDALVLNKASVQRGLGRSASYFVYEGEARLYAMGERDRIQRPEEGVRGYRGIESYSLLDDDGVVGVETKVSGSDVIIGRTSPPRFLEERVEIWGQSSYRRDTSVVVKPSHSGYVDTIIMTEDTEQNRLIKVRLRDTRTPETGDKFASRAGQKGVVGAIIPQEDMPFTESGMVPDALINPHAIPSRMTIGHFLEAIFGKAAAISGRQRKGDAFVHEDQENIFEILRSYGLHPYGEEMMVNGMTGMPMKAKVFIGPSYYQRLHHMVKDKMHARARGQITLLTHQPTEGRARGGGLRFGEMERDCLVGHGASRLLQDRLLEESDKTTIYVCENCGTVGYYDSKQRKYVCKMCGKDVNISAVSISYAFKLLLQEIMSLGIYPRINLTRRV
jgi:DNA-directed RNA polymerase subunit B